MPTILAILTGSSALAFAYFFYQAITINLNDIQSAQQQAASALELLKAGLAWVALCITLTGVAIIQHIPGKLTG